MIKKESIQQVKDRIDIVEVVTGYIPTLKRSGRNYFARCPFHGERTPSFSISPERKLVHCFGCGYSGDAIKFVMDMDKVTYVEAVEKLAAKYGIALEREHGDPEAYNERRVLQSALADVAQYYHEMLLKDKMGARAREYLATRGVKAETVERFKLGYAPDGNVLSRLHKKHDLSTLHKAGLVNFFAGDSVSQERPYDYFRDRVIFPVFDAAGRIVSFGGRLLPDSVAAARDKAPSYLNGPDTVVFNKGGTLYGMFQAKEDASKAKAVCVVEGYMDVIILHQEGFRNTVAPLGTALTESQLKLVKRFAETVYLMFDPDTAGRNATLSAIQLVYRSDLYPLVITLPEAVDPDEYVLSRGQNALLAAATQASSAVKFAANHYLRQSGKAGIGEATTQERISLLRKLVELTLNIANPVAKSDAIREIAQELRINEEIVRGEVKKAAVKAKASAAAELATASDKPYTCEEELLRVVVQRPDAAKMVPEEAFSHEPALLAIFRALREAYAQGGDVDAAMAHLPEEQKALVVRMVFDPRELPQALDKLLAKLFDEVSREKYKKRYKELKPMIDGMLEGRIPMDPAVVNEYRQVAEVLKK